VSTVVVLTCLLSLQQLTVGPAPSSVGQELVVRATVLGEPAVKPGSAAEAVPEAAAGVVVSLELPDGTSRELGVTDASGLLKFHPEVPGQHAFSADLSGVRCVASLPIAPARNRWLLAIVCVPLGLAVMWLQIRRLLAGRRRIAGS
jgi:hypothetical protein